ncbi:MAG: phosphoribosylformylglycinamidine synthase [Fibrobacter sp.]|nr:phosphoribosylformylglycinamidine synthase [Fibrobacter sp.]
MASVRRIFVEKKKGYDVAAHGLFTDLRENLGIKGLQGVRIIIRYDIEGITDDEYTAVRNTIFAEPPVDVVHDETLPLESHEKLIAIEYLPGQYDQRADSAAQCIQLMTHGNRPSVATAQIISIRGHFTDSDIEKIKKYCVNPVDSREASLDKPETLGSDSVLPQDVAIISGFTTMQQTDLDTLRSTLGLAMRIEDLTFTQNYFRETEKRDPSLTEIRMLDTYWSDHCRHTTFLTRINNVEIENGFFSAPIEQAYTNYLEGRNYVLDGKVKPVCLMDLATLGMKELRKRGILNDLDESEEINACSIVVPVEIDGHKENWLVMFKNETHNHPTEIEPFGGAATCLGGAIRDPLSGRSYVYQAMRVTGAGDPRCRIEDTLPGKLPQRKITTLAAHGYSSYGNQIGLATGHVAEIYDEGYVAKRMEIGAVIGAAPADNVVREQPVKGDIVVLLGGRTGRDGCGGATGSSKEHTEESINTCSAEVQKGNPPTERKIQRLFRKPEVSKLIKRCNDFGAGGVSVAIGELAAGLDIDLDAVPKKYDGLDGTELAISESQERMAVVIDKSNLRKFIDAAAVENLETAVVAEVTDTRRLRMKWRAKTIVDISRDFIDTNGAPQDTDVTVTSPDPEYNFFKETVPGKSVAASVKDAWNITLSDLNICSQKGLIERFDSTIGSGTVAMPFGGTYQMTPTECMIAKLPVLKGETNCGTIMSYGYNPRLSKWSPFHGAVFAVIESVAKIVASGGDHHRIRLTLQEYFERTGTDRKRWGKPFAALLGAYAAQKELGIAAIGGKDSMSGTFRDMNVPPTLVSFALAPADISKTISPEFKKHGSQVLLIKVVRNTLEMPDFAQIDKAYTQIHNAIVAGHVLSAHTVKSGGIAEAVTKMCFGNKIGISIDKSLSADSLFVADIGSIILELDSTANVAQLFNDIPVQLIGSTIGNYEIITGDTVLDLRELQQVWEEPLEKVFPSRTPTYDPVYAITPFTNRNKSKAKITVAKPRVLITVFPGTNCEYDTARAFEKAGAVADVFVMKNLTPSDIGESISTMVKKVENSQILMIPGGFSAGDEPDGSGKFIAAFFRNPHIRDAVNKLLLERDGLALGICNGFQALIKLGLVPHGRILDMNSQSPTLTFNTIGRHISCMAYTKISSVKSPWLSNVECGDIHAIAVSHGEGRFVASQEEIQKLISNGQVATQYVDCEGNVCGDISGNPNGSMYAIEGITSPDGRVLGKMGHSERIGSNVAKNISGNKDQRIFESGVAYFK